MKHIAYILFLALLLASCGAGSGHFKIDGRLLNLNNGEFYVYSPDGAIDGMDTIKVEGGRFAYEIPCEKPATLMIVFPNFSEQPVFTQPGKSVEIRGDASHLKEIKTEGTKENELMNSFRKQIVSASPPQMAKYAAQLIKDHPKSIVGTYLVRKYFIANGQPDYKQALSLIQTMRAQQPDNGYLTKMYQLARPLASTAVGNTIPPFSEYGVNGERVDNAYIRNAKVAVIYVWATWNYESMNIQRQLKKLQRDSQGQMRLIGICVDASKRDCREALKRDSIPYPNVCDELMLDCPTLKALGLMSVPGNLILRYGRVVARDLSNADMQEKLRSMM